LDPDANYGSSGITNQDSIDDSSNRRVINSAASNKFRISKAQIDDRLDKVRKFIIMRVSSTPESEDWSTVCAPGMIHRMPKPYYRVLSKIGSVDNQMYECQGEAAIIDDTNCRKDFILSVKKKSI